MKNFFEENVDYFFLYRKMTEEFDEDSADYPLVTPGNITLFFFILTKKY